MSDQDNDDELEETLPHSATDYLPGGYNKTKAMIAALDVDMSAQEFEAALQGVPYQPEEGLLLPASVADRRAITAVIPSRLYPLS